MKKQNNRQSNGNKLEAPALNGTDAMASRHVQREAGERSISSDGALDRIRARAYHLFELRGRQPGHAMEDWLQAERELLRPSPSPKDRAFTGIC